jgi:hypothetical protein
MTERTDAPTMILQQLTNERRTDATQTAAAVAAASPVAVSSTPAVVRAESGAPPSESAPAAAAAATSMHGDDDDDDLSSDDAHDGANGLHSRLHARIAQTEAQVQQGQAHLAQLTSQEANADAAAAAHAAPMAMDPDDDDGANAAAVPLAVRLSALRTTDLHAHLLLFPSHKNDATYFADDSVPPAERKTSFETAGPFEQYGCPVVMNTPDQLINCEPEDDETNQYAAALLASAAAPRASPSSSDAAATEQEVLGSLPSFLFKSASAAAADAAEDSEAAGAGEEGNVVRPGFIQCHKCRKWRTMPLDVDRGELDAEWTCDQNTWEARYARCAAPDEVFEDGEEGMWPFMPKRFLRYEAHEKFYKQLIALLQLQQSTAAELAGGESDHASALEKFPYIRRRPVDLYLMYRSVLALGGYDKVCASNQWRTIQSCLHIADQHDSSQTLKRVYRQLLLAYEQRHWQPPRGHSTTPPLPSSSKSATRSTKPAAPVVATIVDSSSRKRRQKDSAAAASAAAAAAGESDYDDGESARKRARRQGSGLNDVTDADEYGDGGFDEDMSEAEEKSERLVDAHGRPLPPSLPRPASGNNPYAHMSASVPLPSISGVSIGVRNLRSTVESKLRTLEDRVERRLSRMENTLAKAIHDSTAQIVAAAHAQHRALQRMQQEQQRRDELMARGLNMLIAERLTAALPKDLLGQIKASLARERAEAEAEAAATKGASSSSAAAAPAAASAASPHARSASPVPLLPAHTQASGVAAASAASPSRSTVPAASASPSALVLSSPSVPAASASRSAGAASSTKANESAAAAVLLGSNGQQHPKSDVAAAPTSPASATAPVATPATAAATTPARSRPRVKPTHYALITSLPGAPSAAAATAAAPAAVATATTSSPSRPASAPKRSISPGSVNSGPPDEGKMVDMSDEE